MDATAWSTLSDRNAKENIIEIDVEHALEKLAAIPVVQFNYKGVDPEQKHIGIMAQDFHAAFDVAGNPLRISTQDIDGVALAAIQGLYHQLLKERQRNDQLEARIAAIEQILRN